MISFNMIIGKGMYVLNIALFWKNETATMFFLKKTFSI